MCEMNKTDRDQHNDMIQYRNEWNTVMLMITDNGDEITNISTEPVAFRLLIIWQVLTA